MSFQLSTNIIQVLREVREHTMNVMEAFEAISDELSKEFDRLEDERYYDE